MSLFQTAGQCLPPHHPPASMALSLNLKPLIPPLHRRRRERSARETVDAAVRRAFRGDVNGRGRKEGKVSVEGEFDPVLDIE